MNKKVLQKKLNSNEGASLMVALLFFVLCATVGSVVLASATASGGRLANLMKSDQSYLAVSSAADLIAETISGKTSDGKKDPEKEITLEATYDITYDDDNKEIYTLHEDGKILVINNDGNNNLVEVIDKSVLLNMLYNTLFPTSYVLNDMKKTFTSSKYVNFTDDTSPIHLNDSTIKLTGYSDLNVKVDFTMNHDLDLLVKISRNEGSENETVTQLLFKAVKEFKVEERIIDRTDTGDDARTVQMKCDYVVSWDSPVIYKS